MKKNNVLAYSILGIVFILFNIIAFSIPIDRTEIFWVIYSFSVVAIGLQLLIWRVAFNKAQTLKSKFLGIPIIHVGIVYLIIQLISFIVFVAVPTIPNWIVIIVSSLIISLAALCLISVEVGRDEVDRIEEKVQKKVFYIKELQADVEMIAEKETDNETKESLKKIAEKIRFSDPMSNETLNDLESEISNKVSELRTADNKSALILELDELLTERNKKIKILK